MVPELPARDNDREDPPGGAGQRRPRGLRVAQQEGYVQLAGLFHMTVRPTLKRLLDASWLAKPPALDRAESFLPDTPR